MSTQVQIINEELKRELADPGTTRALLTTTFNGLDETRMKQAIMEGMIRGFSFKNFLQKDLYAIPYGKGYSLITSIDFARKIGAKSGVVGKEKPLYEMSEDGKAIISCDVTIKKRFPDGYIGDFTATVYFAEYSTGMNLWKTKPRTMIAKVAEMHALRMACPEELSQLYTEEEMEKKSPEDEMRDKIKVGKESLKRSNFTLKDNDSQKDTQKDKDIEIEKDMEAPDSDEVIDID